jgi:hypothetical protein
VLSACRTAESLKETVDKVNGRRSRAAADPAARIERTLDNQLAALRDIDARTADVERALERMGVSVR